MNDRRTGRIIKALSGFYYVQTDGGVIACRARGKFRQAACSPLVGDLAEISCSGSAGMVERLLPRRNSFVRPAVCNLDLLVVFASNVIPVTEPYLIDRVAAIAGNQNVPVVICVNKSDLDPGEGLLSIYRNAGFCTIATSARTGAGVEQLRQTILGKTAAFTGNSGVGKSSILNCLSPDFHIAVGAVSDKLGRGRHTTRHVELYPLGQNTYIADTPGFSSFDTDKMEIILKENLQYAFSDFAPYLGKCQFHDCAHLREPGCAVRQAVDRGALEKTRYESYCRLYEKAKEVREWELKPR